MIYNAYLELTTVIAVYNAYGIEESYAVFYRKTAARKINAAYSLDGISMARPVGITAVSPHERVSGSFKKSAQIKTGTAGGCSFGDLGVGVEFFDF